MKEKIRALVALIILVGGWYLISSQDVFYDVRKTDDLKKIESIIAEELKDKELSGLSIISDSEESIDSDFSSIGVRYYLDGRQYVQQYTTLMFMSSWGEPNDQGAVPDNLSDREDIKRTFKFEEIDFNKLEGIFNEAVALIPEGYENFHIGLWRFSMDQYLIKEQKYSETLPGSGPISSFKIIPAVYGDFLKTQLVIQATKVGESKDREGLTTITYYYEFSFEIDHEGVLKLVE